MMVKLDRKYNFTYSKFDFICCGQTLKKGNLKLQALVIFNIK